MTYKPGFIYMRSASLEQMIAYSKKTGCVFCEDKTVYTANELQLFHDADAEADLAVHLIKKIFGGEVVKIERNLAGNTEAERIAGSATESNTHHPTPVGSLPPPTGKSEGGGDGELDIY